LPLAEQRLTSGVNTTENRTPMADLTSQTVRVPAGCPRAGVPLANLPGLRALGVLICGIQRGRDRRVLPGGGDHFEAGDQLLVVGTHDQILAFQAWLEGIETPAR
ncbi:MAG: TrkA C-terminal domain-containing protein, partial [Verrucomicrobiota bacterium]